MNDRPDKSKIQMLANLIVLNAVSKGATRIEIALQDTTCVVWYRINGENTREMSPPYKLHERLIDSFGEMCGMPRHEGVLRGTAKFYTGSELRCSLDVTIQRAAGRQTSAFIEVQLPEDET